MKCCYKVQSRRFHWSKLRLSKIKPDLHTICHQCGTDLATISNMAKDFAIPFWSLFKDFPKEHKAYLHLLY